MKEKFISRRFNSKNETNKEFRARLYKTQKELSIKWDSLMQEKYWPEYKKVNS